MRNWICIFTIIILFFSSFCIDSLKAEEKPPKSVCVEEYNKQWKAFNEQVLSDIVSSFNLDLAEYKEIKRNELDLNAGEYIKNNYDKISLKHLFVGAARGDMRLFLKDGLDGTKGYFLYKRTDGNNVVKELSKNGDIWVVMTVKEKQSQITKWEEFDWDKCKKN